MTTKRLFRRPKHTEDVLGEITSGASTTDEVAEGLGNSRKTAMNKIHDGVILGLVNREDGHLSVTERLEAGRPTAGSHPSTRGF